MVQVKKEIFLLQIKQYIILKRKVSLIFIKMFIGLKRRIAMEIVSGITVNKKTDEFVIHCREKEYDYHYISRTRKDIIAIIAKNYMNINGQKIPLSEVTDNSLKNFVTTRTEKKSDPSNSKMSKNEEDLVDVDVYLSRNNDTSNNNTSEININNTNSTKDNHSKTQTMFSNHNSVKQVQLEDFKVLKVIGRGSFGKVCLVEYLPRNEIYAMKSLKKDILIEQEQIENTLLEKEILQTIDHPLLCGLVFCFQTSERIYFIMPFLCGGELFHHLRKFRTFDEEKVRFYGAQIAIALDYLHTKGIIYRDLKPENILMDELGYLRLADFGMAKKLKEGEKAMSFCGTPEYLAPEIITGEGHNKSADWWSFGILIYEMLCGIPPFYVENLERMYEMIKKGTLKFPKKIILSEDAKDLIKKVRFHIYIMYIYNILCL